MPLPARRRVLKYLGSGALLASLAGTADGRAAQALREPAGRRLAGLRRIGSLYLAAVPEERDAALLARRLPPACVAALCRDDLATARLATALRACRQRDFAEGDTLLLQGWLLSRSEARLCALLALAA